MKNKKSYLITIGITLGIFLILFIGKNIFPFGENSLIWGDMHDQVTAFYYQLYDAFRGNSSLLVNFSTGGGINFLGILAYYILSPFSLLVLLFDREKIYLVVSIIIMLKTITASVTCLYMLKNMFKKLSDNYAIILSVLYGFSAYTILMYQITPWMDVVYLFPLIVVGLKNLLDGKSPKLYIITLTISIILCFYVTYMSLIFIFFMSLLYLLVYKKDDRKKGIVSLGISTVLSMIMSAFIAIPAYKQISISSRLGIDLDSLLNSKTGPITDKAQYFLMAAFVVVVIVLLIKEFKKHKEFLTFFIPASLFVLIPVLIEPVHKLLHLGSYAFFPYRFGFVTMILFIIGAAYYIEKKEIKEKKITNPTKTLSILITLLSVMLTIILTVYFYPAFQRNVYTLTISADKRLILVLIGMFIINFSAILGIILLNKSKKNFQAILIGIITVTHISCLSYMYIGIDYKQEFLMSQYEDMNKIEETYKEDDPFRIKNDYGKLIMNSGMVTKYHTLDHFTSLTEDNNIKALKKLGYSSMWVKTFSKGGTMFSDLLLANKYAISKEKYNNEYYNYIDTYGKIQFYELNKDISYGYFINKNDTIFDKNNSFEIQNSLYKNITETNNILFKYSSKFNLENVRESIGKEYIHYDVIDDDQYAYLDKTIKIDGKQRLYLEVLKSISNNDNYDIYEMTNVYVNDKLYKKKWPSENDNGVLDLGTYENDIVNIKIEIKEDLDVDQITLATMDLKMYEDFIINEKIDTNIKFNENEIKITVNSDDKKTLFIPLTYSDNYTLVVNGEKQELTKLYENFMGIEVTKGTNNITLSYVPAGFKLGTIISLIGLGITIMLLKTKAYTKIIENSILQKIIYYGYLVVYNLGILLVYVFPIICFILSYFIVIKL